jgi:hypothetical protein
MALWAMGEATSPGMHIFSDNETPAILADMSQSVEWLRKTEVRDASGLAGWRVNPSNPSETNLLGLTAQTLCILGRLPIRIDQNSATDFQEIKKHCLRNIRDWADISITMKDDMRDTDCYLYPTDFVIEQSSFVRYPWCIGMLRSFSTDPDLDPSQKSEAAAWEKRLEKRVESYTGLVENDGNYVAAEGLIGLNWPMNVQNIH